ncbi:Calx-beta domain-containing protein [Roseomonas sp. BN140053]|uniref:Calx-beta domain-containing protein n=1 Tax=Roseomonas sp. BN140053 TaxID=3391898 RepID=UPI0039E9C136
MATLLVSGQVPGTILESTGPEDWTARLQLQGGLGATEVALTGADAARFTAVLDLATQVVTITPAQMLDREAWAAGADPVLSFGLQVRVGSGWQAAGGAWNVQLLGVDDTPPAGLRFSSGGVVLESDVGAEIGELAAIDPDTRLPLQYSVAWPDSAFFEIVNGRTLKLLPGVDLLRQGGTTRPVIVTVSDGHQDVAMQVDVRVLNVTTLDDTPVPPVLFVADAAMAEGNAGTAPLVFTVTLSRAMTTPVTVRWDAVGGTATPGTDFDAAGGTLTFAPGQTSATMSVPVRGDTAVEPDETFRLVLSAPSGVTLARAEAVGTIRNDDIAAPVVPAASVADASVLEGHGGTTSLGFTVSLSQATTVPVTLRWDAIGGTATPGTDFEAAGGTLTFAPGQTSVTVSVNVRGDTAVEPDETFRLVLSAPAGATLARAEAVGTIRNDDVAAPVVPAVSVADASVLEGHSGTTSLGFTVSLSQASAAPVVVRWDALGGTATPGIDFEAAGGTLTFAPGQTSATVAVTVRGDTVFEPDETFRLVLSAPSGATLGRAEAAGTIRNDDVIPAVSVGDAAMAEGNAGTSQMAFNVTLSQASSAPVTVRWDAVGGTATPGTDFEAAGGILTFAPGQTSATVAVTVRGDTVFEPDEAFRLVLSSPSAATLARAEAIGTIRNDDTMPAVSVADAIMREGDAGTTAMVFNLSLSQASAAPVTVRWNALGGTATLGTDFEAAGGILTFAPGQTSASVAVNIRGDTVFEPDETLQLVLDPPDGATLARAAATGTITNDDARPPPDEVIWGSSGIDAVPLAIGLRGSAVTTSGGLPSHVSGPGHSYAVNGVEVLIFADGRLVFDPGDPAAQAVRLYNAALARSPDQAGLNFYIDKLQHGAGLADVAGGFNNSPEFQARFGPGLSNDAYVVRLYQNVLHRGAAESELNYYRAQFAAGQSREQTLVNFSESPENKDLTAATVQAGIWDLNEHAAVVARLYDTMLGRKPDLGGLMFYREQLDAGRIAPLDIVQNFIGSPEFQARYGANPSSTQFVELLYQNALHRDATPGEVQYYASRLDAGTLSRAEVVMSFSDSPEHVALTASDIINDNPTHFGIAFA